MAILAILFVLKFSILNVSLLGISGVISLFYVFKIRGRNLREVPFLKIHLISFSWVAILIVFPLINENEYSNFLPLCIAHYLYVLAVTIPFDIRDLKFDMPHQKTIPQMIGVAASKALSVWLLLIFGWVMIYFVDGNLMTNPMFVVSILVQILLVLFMNENRSDIYCAGLIDGAIALLGMSYFLM